MRRCSTLKREVGTGVGDGYRGHRQHHRGGAEGAQGRQWSQTLQR